jgi:hypothetical protein
MLTTSTDDVQRRAIQQAVCGQVAGGLSTLAFYPLDVVKIRFMSQDGTAARQHNSVARYTSFTAATRLIVAEEGVRALYRGAAAAMLSSAVSWGLYMFMYRRVEAFLGRYTERRQLQCTGAALAAGAAASVATNPLWLIKARMQLEEADARRAGGAAARHYTSLAGGLRHVAVTTGVASLWRGTSAQVLLGIPMAMNFPVYEAAKRWRLAATGEAQLGVGEVCACTVVSKTFVASASHPITVLKVRLQDHRSRVGDVRYESLLASVATIVRREGMRGMFRGWTIGVAHSVPRSALHFVVYELCLRQL